MIVDNGYPRMIHVTFPPIVGQEQIRTEKYHHLETILYLKISQFRKKPVLKNIIISKQIFTEKYHHLETTL